MAFDTYGGYADVTWQFLHRITKLLANNNHKLADKLMRNMREIIAVTLVKMQGRLIDDYNQRNR